MNITHLPENIPHLDTVILESYVCDSQFDNELDHIKKCT
jgi:C4-type Zn-finger protein